LQKWFTWDLVHEDRITRNFERRGNVRFRDFLGGVRKHNKKPVWLGDAEWEGLQQHLVNEHYKKLRETTQKNRLSTPESGGPSLCTYDSIREHRSHLVNEFAMYFSNFNTVVWLVVDIILYGMYLEGTTWDEAHYC